MAGGDGCMHGCIDGWSVNKGGRGCGGRAQHLPPQCEPSIDSILENTGLCGFGCLVCWLLVGYQGKASIDSIWGKRLVAWFVRCWWATHPFFFALLPLVGVLVGSACLACCLLGFGESTYSDGWIMDREKKGYFLVCWFVGLLAVSACVIQ